MPDPEDLTEHCISSETIVKSDFIELRRDQVELPSGNHSQREYVVHPGAVLVLPLLDNGDLVFERQYRYPMRGTYIELPAGKIDPNEDILSTGQRELLEETGYSATDWKYLAELHPCIGYSNEVIHIFLAKGLTLGKAKPDADEHLQIFTMPLKSALEAVFKGDIRDGKTMVALFWLDKYLNAGWNNPLK